MMGKHVAGWSFPQSNGAAGLSAGTDGLQGTTRSTRRSASPRRPESFPRRLIDSPNVIGPPAHQAYLTRLWGRAINLRTDPRMLAVKGGGGHSNDHPIQWTDAKTKICAKRERQACDRSSPRNTYEDICGGSWPTPNAIVLTGETDKEKCVMFNVQFFAAFRSNKLEVHTAFDLKNSAAWRGRGE